MAKICSKRSGTVVADVADPGEVAVDRPRLVELAPEVNQHELLGPDYAVMTGDRLVVRVAAVRANAHDRRAVSRHPVAMEVIHDRPLDLGLADRPARLDPLGDEAQARS